MKIKINSISSDKNVFIEGELLQTLENLRQGKIDISNIISKYSWLVDEKSKYINNPKCFIITYDRKDCDVEVTLYDYCYE